MAFLSSFDICASGMSAQRVRMDIAAENIAHINTTRTEAGGPTGERMYCLKVLEPAPFVRQCEARPWGMDLPAGMPVLGFPVSLKMTGK